LGISFGKRYEKAGKSLRN